MLDQIVVHKRQVLEHSKINENLDENEKDLLTLMIEAELQGEGSLTNDELMVKSLEQQQYLDHGLTSVNLSEQLGHFLRRW